jgi:hypothetical protein
MTQISQIASDSLGNVLRGVFAAPEFQWDRPRSIVDVVRDWQERLRDMLATLQESHPVAYYMVLGLLTGVLVAILVHFSYLIWQVIKPRAESGAAVTRRGSSPRGANWYLNESRRLMSDGNFTEAMAVRFRALLLDLDRRHVVRFHPSKTPAEYLPEIRLDDEQRGVFAGLIGALYRHLFGGSPCSETDVVRFSEVAADLEGYAAAR